MPPAPNELTEEELLNQCRDNFYLAATIQGRISYLLMSIHVANPNIFASLTDYDPTHLFFTNMVYGMTIHLFSRPSMTMIGFLHRLSFRIHDVQPFQYASLRVGEKRTTGAALFGHLSELLAGPDDDGTSFSLSVSRGHQEHGGRKLNKAGFHLRNHLPLNISF